MYEVAIVGAGPAGLTAALYAGRFRLNTFIFEKISPGGQIILSPEIENYPGFPGGVATLDLIAKFRQQIEELGLRIEGAAVLGITASEDAKGAFYIIEAEGNTLSARCVIIASGARPKPLGIKGEKEFTGRGVSYCGTCDGALFKEKAVVVVGGGDRAVEEAIYLCSYASKVTLLHRREEFRASKILVDKAKNTPKINLVLASVAEEIMGGSKVEGLKIKNLTTGRAAVIPCAGVFIFAGIQPDTDFLSGFLEIDEQGFIKTDEEMRTSRPGVFACGDCRKKSLYQVITACAEGAVAADSAHKYLLNQ